jgi:hypothetical protein
MKACIDCYEISLAHSKTLFQKRICKSFLKQKTNLLLESVQLKGEGESHVWDKIQKIAGNALHSLHHCPHLHNKILQLPKLKISNTIYED